MGDLCESEVMMTQPSEGRKRLYHRAKVAGLILLVVLYEAILVGVLLRQMQEEDLDREGSPCNRDWFQVPAEDSACRVAVAESDCAQFCGCGWCNLTVAGDRDRCLSSATGGDKCTYALGQWLPSMTAPYCVAKYERLVERCSRYKELAQLLGVLAIVPPVGVALGVWLGVICWRRRRVRKARSTGGVAGTTPETPRLHLSEPDSSDG